jgi:hypothetical protein
MVLRRHYRELARLSKDESDLGHSHSVEEARHRHTRKAGVSGKPETPAIS